MVIGEAKFEIKSSPVGIATLQEDLGKKTTTRIFLYIRFHLLRSYGDRLFIVWFVWQRHLHQAEKQCILCSNFRFNAQKPVCTERDFPLHPALRPFITSPIWDISDACCGTRGEKMLFATQWFPQGSQTLMWNPGGILPRPLNREFSESTRSSPRNILGGSTGKYARTGIYLFCFVFVCCFFFVSFLETHLLSQPVTNLTS